MAEKTDKTVRMTKANRSMLLTFLEELLARNGIPVHRLSPPYEELDMVDQGLRKTIFHSDLYDTLFRGVDVRPHTLYQVTDNFQCTYILLLLPDSEDLLVCGPVVFEQFQGERLAELLEELAVPEELHAQMRDYYMNVAFLASQSYFTSLFTLFAEYLFGRDAYEFVDTDFGERERWGQLYSQYFRIPDQPFLSIQMIEERYKFENILVDAVQSGNESRALEAMGSSQGHSLPSRLNSALRDAKDYSITLNTLMRKAAESAGVHPIHVDSLSNSHVKTIEGLTSVDQCHVFQRQCIIAYCRLVRDYARSSHSPLTQKALTYISTDLCADLSLHSLASVLSVNASYLSSLFKKEMGMPLTEYVNRSRIRHAQKLLGSTELPIKDIAVQCGIPDVYYFSRLFRRIADTTPGAWRESHQGEKRYASFSSGWEDAPRSEGAL